MIFFVVNVQKSALKVPSETESTDVTCDTLKIYGCK